MPHRPIWNPCKACNVSSCRLLLLPQLRRLLQARVALLLLLLLLLL
jgi:hypothetical protein